MRVVQRPKKSGGFRLIYQPSASEKAFLRSYLGHLHGFQQVLCPPMVVHGFWQGRSPVSNAWCHRSYRHTLSVDLKDWFDSVRKDQLGAMGERSGEFWERALIDGAPRQGLPTSPLLANIAASSMDWAIVEGRQSWYCYTRYADDLTISADDMDTLEHAEAVIETAVANMGWTLSRHKRRVQHADRGRRIVTGVAVDDATHCPRKFKRLIRACQHQRLTHRAEGMDAWRKYCGAMQGGVTLELWDAQSKFDAAWKKTEDLF